MTYEDRDGEAASRPEYPANRRGRGCLITFVVAAAVIAFGLWAMSGDKSTLRSRLTLVVETPEGDRSGSSVSQVTILSPGPCNRAIGFSSLGIEDEEGEAVVVDLGARGVLFVTLADEKAIRSGRSGMYNAGLTLFSQKKFRGKVGGGLCSKDEYAAYLDEVQRQKPRGDLPFEYLPVLVRFRDTNDPAGVEWVDPSDLAKSFGQGVRLKRAFIEITDDPLTKEIESRLPWLAQKAESGVRRSLIPMQGLQTLAESSTIELLGYKDFRVEFHR